jgi:hypothetical protein
MLDILAGKKSSMHSSKLMGPGKKFTAMVMRSLVL